ncbi:hypothetical protein QYF36_007645 [Acer negundo]|nr:hypothetical protein QYF36_007645 [Acer negundo]
MQALMRRIEANLKTIAEVIQSQVYEEPPSQPEQEDAATIPSNGEIVNTIVSCEFSDDFSSVADEGVEKEETEEKAKEAEDVSLEEPLLCKELKPYIPPITFPSHLHKRTFWHMEISSKT